MYARQAAKRFGLRAAAAKPLKRPAQARARFTVQAIYGAFVRIWQLEGWEGISTRAVALEAGIAVGTLYEYFPNKHALLSGYVRHCLEGLVQAIAVQPMTLARLVSLMCDPRAEGMPPFDAQMLDHEHEIAEHKHQLRAYAELLGAWRAAIESLYGPVDEALTETLFVAIWGGRRYLLLVQPPFDAQTWVEQMHTLCAQTLALASEKE